MGIGKFKSSRGRLILWVLIPPVLIASVGLSSQGLRTRSEWELKRTEVLVEVLPRLARVQAEADAVLQEFRGEQSTSIKTEDELISYLQNAAGKVGFTIDSLKVERRRSANDKNVPMLVAEVKGIGTFIDVENYLGEVSAGQTLLYESSLKVSRSSTAVRADECHASITFDLVLFSALNPSGGGL